MTVLTYTNAPAPSPLDDAEDRAPLAKKWLVLWAAVVAVGYALLWSPHWYPLSDSSLFLSLGRSLATGKGMTIQGDPVRLVPPGAPLIVAAIMKLGGGIGTLQAAMIAFILAAHALTFLTLRRWVGDRLALTATVAGAASYWVFINAFTIMSEPPALMFLWGGLLALSGVTLARRGKIPWPRFAVAVALLLFAAACRDAVLMLLPGFFLMFYLAHRRAADWRTHAKWAAVVAVVFGAWTVYRYPERFAKLVGIDMRVRPGGGATQPTTGPTTGPATQQSLALNPNFDPNAINAEFDPDSPTPLREGKYKFRLMYGVERDFKSMLTMPPVLAGRWLSEGMVAASSILFDEKVAWSRTTGYALGAIGFCVLLAGVASLVARRQWWVLAPTLYFLSIWLQWGTRIKARYMGLIAPLLFIVAAAGIVWAARWVAAAFGATDATKRSMGRVVAYTMLGLVLVGNAAPWAVEVYIRHADGRDFYETARRGAYAQLVDIGGYLQKNAKPDEVVWMNVGAHRRIAYFLAGRRMMINETYCFTPNDWYTGKSMRKFRQGMNPWDRYAIVYTEHPGPKLTWPTWHLPLTRQEKLPDWWRLFERTPDGWKQVQVPAEREYVRGIPVATN